MSFTPNDISNTILKWYDALDLSLSDDTGIESWADKGSDNTPLVQSNSSLRPIYKASTLNGLPAVRFIRANDLQFDENTNLFNTTANRTIVLVTSNYDLSTENPIYGATSLNARGHFYMRDFSNAEFHWGVGGDPFNNRRIGVREDPQIVMLVESDELYVNNVAQGGIPDSNSDTGVSSRGYFKSQTLDALYDGDVHEFYIIDGALSETDRNDLYDYLNSKWIDPSSQFTLTTNVTGEGSISKDPDSGQYNENDEVELTADPDEGWEFDRWEGDLTGSTNPDTVTMDDDKTVSAVFVETDFRINSPEDQATVNQPFNFEVNNPNSVEGFLKQISENSPVNDQLENLSRDILTGSPSTTIDDLPSDTQHWLKAIELLSLGGISDSVLFSANFNDDNAESWGDDFTEINAGGTTQSFVDNGVGSITLESSSRRFVDVNNLFFENANIVIEFETDNVSESFQPTFYFRSQGEWSENNRKRGYWVWLFGETIQLGRTSASFSNQVFQSEPFVRSANTEYSLRILIEGFRIRVAIWESSESQDGWIIDYTDTSEVSSQGGISMNIATTGSASSTRLDVSSITCSLVSTAPQITNIDTSSDTATISYSEVAFDNGGYEYRIREVGEGFGSWVNVSDDNPFNITGLDSGQYEVQISAIHNNQRSALSDIVEFEIAPASVNSVSISPENPELSEEEDSFVQLTASVDVSGGASENVDWTVESGPSGITVDETGRVSHDESVSATDTAVIRATSVFDQNQFAEVTLTVVEAVDVTIEDSAQADKETLAAIYEATGADWESEKEHFDPGGKQGEDPDFYTHTGNATGWSTDPNEINLDPSGTLPFGVEVEQINGEWRVVSLKLNANTDVGWITPQVRSNIGQRGGNNLGGVDVTTEIGIDFNWQLYQLRYVNLKQNYIRLHLPRKLFTPNIEYIYWNGRDIDVTVLDIGSFKTNWWDTSNFIQGVIPKEIGNATSLKTIEAKGRWWGVGDQEPHTGGVTPDDQYAVGGEIPDEIVNSPIELFDFWICKFTGLPSNMNNALRVFRMSFCVRNPQTDLPYTYGLGVSQLGFLENRPNLVRASIDRLFLGYDTEDSGPIPDLSASVDLRSIAMSYNGITGPLPLWLSDGTISGNAGGGIGIIYFAANNPSGIEDPGFSYGFTHRFGRSVMTLTNCSIPGEFPESWIDPGVINFNISGNHFNNSNWPPQFEFRNFQRIRNFFIAGNSFGGHLPALDWYSRYRQETQHGLRAFSRISVSGTNINLTWTVPKEPWEIEAKQCRWYYDNKNNIISNVDPSYTLGQAVQDGYSESFINSTLGNSNWQNSDSAFSFFQTILNKIFNGWRSKDF